MSKISKLMIITISTFCLLILMGSVSAADLTVNSVLLIKTLLIG